MREKWGATLPLSPARPIAYGASPICNAFMHSATCECVVFMVDSLRWSSGLTVLIVERTGNRGATPLYARFDSTPHRPFFLLPACFFVNVPALEAPTFVPPFTSLLFPITALWSSPTRPLLRTSSHGSDRSSCVCSRQTRRSRTARWRPCLRFGRAVTL